MDEQPDADDLAKLASTMPPNEPIVIDSDLRLVGEHEPELIEIPPGARTRINLATRSRRIE